MWWQSSRPQVRVPIALCTHCAVSGTNLAIPLCTLWYKTRHLPVRVSGTDLAYGATRECSGPLS
eukprot:86826-Rhodomonas_salina.1